MARKLTAAMIGALTAAAILPSPVAQADPDILTPYNSLCAYLYSLGDQWPDGPATQKWLLDRYPYLATDLTPDQLNNLINNVYQDFRCENHGT
ncbi:hypothetical protein [Mycobacterium sp. 29Ha]|uniref:hypothetical protein n=1 Tax=Mycobacterium sp. 29Ha TaxID=2939268 RepID=UPI00293951A4|nr:hypothetical protein [Mycobacterium sp. 29Ha]MDV3135329.1 hypothetical protein [Mycobacterium sp. 29Ha]